MEINQKVTHPEYGKGIVKYTRNLGQIIDVDYKGVLRTHAKSEFQKQNTYVPKPDVIKVLNEVQKLQIKLKNEVEVFEELEKPGDKIIILMNEKKAIIKSLENILQGKSINDLKG